MKLASRPPPVVALLALAVFPLLPLAPERSAAAAPEPRPTRGLALETVARGLEHPLYVTAPARDPRLFIVEQPGRIRIVRAGRLLPAPFLDLTRQVGYGGERGLLGLAFDPGYARTGLFFVNYTDRSGNTRIDRFRVSLDPDRANLASRTAILEVDQPYANHNGGDLVFGPDSMLYIGMGDGGSGGDPHGNGQNRGALLGKLLRLDVRHGSPYSIPPDNPFRGRPGMRGEIWAWGLRNPWRFCFDPVDDLLYIADVGQDRWEEIDIVPRRAAGLNFGWNRMEGTHCFPGRSCDTSGLTLPVVEYGHDRGCSVTGGFVYRGRRLPSLVGHYFYGDYCQERVWSFRYARGQITDHREWRLDPGPILSFGTDSAGELYICSGRGVVYRLGPDLHK